MFVPVLFEINRTNIKTILQNSTSELHSEVQEIYLHPVSQTKLPWKETQRSTGAFGSDSWPLLSWTDLGALYVVVQVVPEGVDEVDGVVSGIGIGVTWKQDWKHHQSTDISINWENQSNDHSSRAPAQVLTKGDVSNVVPDSGVCVLQLQRGLPVIEQHLGGCVAGSPTLFELLHRTRKSAAPVLEGLVSLFRVKEMQLIISELPEHHCNHTPSVKIKKFSQS